MFKPEHQPDYLSLHIPKTAGLSLSHFFRRVFPEYSVYFYYKDSRGLTSAENLERDLSFADITLPFSIVHGHDIDTWVRNLYPDAKLVTVLRNPLQRAVSHYFYVKHQQEIGRPVPSWNNGLDFNVPLEEFIMNEDLANFQIRFLAELEFNNFSLVGITEQLPAFCAHFDPNGKVGIPQINKRRIGPENIELKKSTIEKFNSQNRDDINLYKSVFKYWDNL